MQVQLLSGAYLSGVRMLSEYARLVLETPIQGLRPAAVRFLIGAYSTSRGPGLRWAHGSFGKRNFKVSGGMHVATSGVGALYDDAKHTLFTNDDASGDISKRVRDVLHEIQHYNQHARWDGDQSYRDRFTKGKQLPPDVEDDPPLLYELEWGDLVKFWGRRYGYADSPHEVDARRFAEKNLEEALGAIQEHGLDED